MFMAILIPFLMVARSRDSLRGGGTQMAGCSRLEPLVEAQVGLVWSLGFADYVRGNLQLKLKMCGIAGKLYFDPQRRVDPVLLDRMTSDTEAPRS
jgi:hypothetical protein